MPRRYAKILSALCAAAVAVVLCAVPARAEAADTARAGSVTVTLRCADAPVACAGFTVYRAAEAKTTGGLLVYELTADFAGSGLDPADPDSAALAEGLASWAGANALTGLASGETDENGRVSFDDLSAGLYLVRQTAAVEGYYPVSAFLVSVPTQETGGWVYDVEASPKAEAGAPAPASATTEPVGRSLAQTGQLNWPVPVLAGLGVILFAVGWMLYFSGRKNGDA